MSVILSTPNIIVCDHNGHRYSIPPYTKEEFTRIKEAVINAEEFSSEWHEALDELHENFIQYLKA